MSKRRAGAIWPWTRRFWSDAWYGFRWGAMMGWIVGGTLVLLWIIGLWIIGR